jgi:purine-binding chemotaxis protein CheW
MMTQAAGPQQLVTFSVAGDDFATDIFSVERVLRYVPPRPVPNTPEWLLGVIDYQGRVVPVLDMRRRFELPPGKPGTQTRTIVFVVDGQWVAAVVDSVREVATVARSDIEPPPPIFRGLTREYLTGLFRGPNSVVIVLDASRLLTSQERLVLEAAAGGSVV